MNRVEIYRQAKTRAQVTKAAFLADIEATKARVKPARLKSDFRRKLSDKVSSGKATAAAHIRERPIAFGAAAAALVLFLARKPLMALSRRIYVHVRPPEPDNSETE